MLQRAFTIVELAVVIAVIGLVLAIAVPGLQTMSRDSRLAAAVQSVSGTLNRAHYTAQADRNLTAVRFVPAPWDIDEESDTAGDADRQHMVNYRYIGSTQTETTSGSFVAAYGERFERREGVDSIVLPADIGVAPIEAWRDERRDPLDTSRSPLDLSLMDGEIGSFTLDPTPASGGENLLEADDFLIVFDPQTGVRGGRQEFALKAYDPDRKVDAVDDGTTNPTRPRFVRSSSEGVVIYRREPMLALGNAASGQDRQSVLRRFGRPYFVHRLSGGLIAGTQEE